MIPTHSSARAVARGAMNIWIVVLLVIGGLGLWLAGGYNGLVSEQTVVEQKASDIDTQLKRRADLIPNLVNTVKGYAKHESGVFKDIADARSRLLSADSNTNPSAAAAANQRMSGALGRLLALAEQYPDLKANQNFTQLQDELAGTENRINYARLSYNEEVRHYNQSVRSFPSNLIAGVFNFHDRTMFQATEEDRKNPTVQF